MGESDATMARPAQVAIVLHHWLIGPNNNRGSYLANSRKQVLILFHSSVGRVTAGASTPALFLLVRLVLVRLVLMRLVLLVLLGPGRC